MSLVTVESKIGMGASWRDREEALARQHGEILPARSFQIGEVVEFLTSEAWERVRVDEIVDYTGMGRALADLSRVPYVPGETTSLVSRYADVRIEDLETGMLRPLTRSEMEARDAAARQIAWVSVTFLREDGSDWRYEDGGLRRGITQDPRRVPAPVVSSNRLHTVWRADDEGIGGVYAEGTYALRAFHNQAERFLAGRVPAALRAQAVIEHVLVQRVRAEEGSPVEHLLREVAPGTRGAKAITLYRLPGWTLSP